MVAAFNTVNVTSVLHDRPGLDPVEPIIWEGSSWLTFVLFAAIPWAALRLAPFDTRPRWRLALHLPALVLFSLPPRGRLHPDPQGRLCCWPASHYGPA